MQFLQFDNKMQSPKVQSADGGDRHGQAKKATESKRDGESIVGKEPEESIVRIELAKSATGSRRVLDQFRPLSQVLEHCRNSRAISLSRDRNAFASIFPTGPRCILQSPRLPNKQNKVLLQRKKKKKSEINNAQQKQLFLADYVSVI